jgi:hypothetical protein
MAPAMAADLGWPWQAFTTIAAAARAVATAH